ncbi:hypothetical protein P43SY_007219 [Pythium insidiosum]|uniref:Uncharacterized protein n=1 Tax=Pythium insidiosum TaxID=114742 RepID=A0AAD5LKG2_PYTIN|nr:hypothetical protein P43SY_007219 [Pythium insidiosum]
MASRKPQAPLLPPLTLVASACRASPLRRRRSDVDVDVLAARVSTFLDVTPFVTPLRAVQSGSLVLLRRVMILMTVGGTSDHVPRAYWMQFDLTLLGDVPAGLDAKPSASLNGRALSPSPSARPPRAGTSITTSTSTTLAGDRRTQWLAQAVEEAARLNRLDMLQCMYSFHRAVFPRSPAIAVRAAEQGHLAVLQWLRKHRVVPFLSSTIKAAVEHGHVAVVQWLRGLRVPWPEQPAVGFLAAKNGHLDMIKWLHRHAEPPSDVLTSLTVTFAAEGGHLEMLQYLEQACGLAGNNVTTTATAAKGHLDVLRHLHERSLAPFNSDAFVGAALGGHVAVLDFLTARRLAMPDALAAHAAAQEGHLGVLQWLHAHERDRAMALPPSDKLWTPKVMREACVNGHLAVVRWLHDVKRLDVIRDRLDDVAVRGHLPVLQYLHRQHHVPTRLSRDALVQVAANGHLAVLRWALRPKRKRAKTRAIPRDAFIEAAGAGHVDVVRWLRVQMERQPQSTVPLAPALEAAASRGHTPVVQLLVEWIETALWPRLGHRPDHEEILSRLRAVVRSVLRLAAMHGHLRIVHWLLSRPRVLVPCADDESLEHCDS